MKRKRKGPYALDLFLHGPSKLAQNGKAMPSDDSKYSTEFK
jgi:hypothetical protein